MPTFGKKEPLAIADIPSWIPEREKNSIYTVQVGTAQNYLHKQIWLIEAVSVATKHLTLSSQYKYKFWHFFPHKRGIWCPPSLKKLLSIDTINVCDMINSCRTLLVISKILSWLLPEFCLIQSDYHHKLLGMNNLMSLCIF